MRTNTITYSLLFMISIVLLNGCSNNKVLHAPNGKVYSVDIESCDKYSIIRDTLFCYDLDGDGNEEASRQYRPVEFGYEIETRDSY